MSTSTVIISREHYEELIGLRNIMARENAANPNLNISAQNWEWAKTYLPYLKGDKLAKEAV